MEDGWLTIRVKKALLAMMRESPTPKAEVPKAPAEPPMPKAEVPTASDTEGRGSCPGKRRARQRRRPEQPKEEKP